MSSNNYNQKFYRIRFFGDSWRGAVRSRDLARVGFYYVGIRAYNHVRFVFCGLDLFNWEEQDDAISENHSRAHPVKRMNLFQLICRKIMV